MSPLHGVETIEIVRGARPIRAVRSAVVGLVGTAPMFDVASGDQSLNTPVLVLSDRDAATKFGSDARAGYTIPQALDAIFDQGAGVVIVVNVFDPATHKTTVAASAKVLGANDKISVAPHVGLTNVVVRNQALSTTYVAGTDYTLDAANGVITRLASGAIAAGATLNVGYDRADPSLVTTSQVIGTVDGSGNRTGAQALRDAMTRFGFAPKLLIAPQFCTQASVASALGTLAGQMRAIAIIDAPIGTTLATALAGRGSSGAINFNTSSARTILCYPHLKAFDPATNAERNEPFSQRLAGVIAARDERFGYHYSPSNTEILGITGVERALTASFTESNSEVGQLNDAGIVAVFNGFGTGLRVWGNRSSAYPSSTAPDNFISIRRTADILEESIEQAMLQYIDQPISAALIDAVTESVNGFIRALIGRGVLVDGSCLFDPTKNPATEIANGHLTFDISFMPPPPAERITFLSVIDTSLLASLGARQSA